MDPFKGTPIDPLRNPVKEPRISKIGILLRLMRVVCWVSFQEALKIQDSGCTPGDIQLITGFRIQGHIIDNRVLVRELTLGYHDEEIP